MPPKRRKYKQWQRNPNVPIPRRTLARLKKEASTCHAIREESFLANCTLGRNINEQRDVIQTDVTMEFEGSEATCRDLDQIKENETHDQFRQEENISCDSESSDDEVQSPKISQCENDGFVI